MSAKGATTELSADAARRVVGCVDSKRLTELACGFVDTPSPTGSEEGMARRVVEACDRAGLEVAWQEVEAGRPNVLATRRGSGDGRVLMFNGHMDTSYSGSEAHLSGRPGFQPRAEVRDGRIWGLGIANMKGAIACYIEALHALSDAGVRLRGDVMVAAVVGEIEKSQWGPEARGAAYRGYSAGSHYLVSHGGAVADACILGEPTEHRIVLGHHGTMWARISTEGPFVHTAFSAGRLEENAILRMAEVLRRVRAWAPDWEARTAYGGRPGVLNVGAVSGGHAWRASRTPDRTDLFLDLRVPPSMPMQAARAELARFVAGLREELPDAGITWEIYVTSPGAEIDPDHELIGAIDAAHREVFGAAPERDTVRWSSDASVLTRYGIASVNYGASSGLPHADGEYMDVEALVRTAQVYALASARICEVER